MLTFGGKFITFTIQLFRLGIFLCPVSNPPKNLGMGRRALLQPPLPYFTPSGGREGDGREGDCHAQSTSGQGEMGEENIELDRKRCTGTKKTVSCNECGISLLSSSLIKHRKRFHSKQRPIEKNGPENKCRETKWEVSARPRTDDICPHTEVGKVRCDECGKDFTTKEKLRLHTRFIHGGEKLHCKVTDCEKTFRGYKSRVYHMRMMHGSPKLMCKFEGCSSEFCSYEGLKKHHLAHHE